MTPDEREAKILDNLPLVTFTIRKYYPTFINNEDIFQDGVVGLIRAVDTFDESRGIVFSTYASVCIINGVRMGFRKEKKQPETISFDQPLPNTEDLTYGDLSSGSYEMDYFDISAFLKKLTAEEMAIFRLRNQGYTQAEIAAITGRSQSMVSRIITVMKKKWDRVYSVKEK